MEQRFAFDQIANVYKAARPDYPEALVEDVVSTPISSHPTGFSKLAVARVRRQKLCQAELPDCRDGSGNRHAPLRTGKPGGLHQC